MGRRSPTLGNLRPAAPHPVRGARDRIFLTEGRGGNESMQMANSGKVDGINSALLDSAYDFAPPRYKISGFRHRLQGAVCNHGFTQGDAALTLG